MARRVLGTFLIAAVIGTGCVCPTRSRADSCPAVGTQSVVVSAIEPGLELRLADHRLVRMVGIEAAGGTPRDPSRSEAVRSTLAKAIEGRALSILPLAARPDRWGRIPVWAFAEGAPLPGGLATTAVGAGMARYRPEIEAAACRSELLTSEDDARRAHLGLWHDPYYSVLAVDDRSAFIGRAGTNVVVEGRLVAVEPGPYRTELRFAASASGGGRRLEASVVPRAIKTFEAQGVNFPALIGRTLRLRGLLDERFGPRIELARPEQIEILPPTGATAPPAVSK